MSNLVSYAAASRTMIIAGFYAQRTSTPGAAKFRFPPFLPRQTACAAPIANVVNGLGADECIGSEAWGQSRSVWAQTGHSPHPARTAAVSLA